MKSGLPSQYSNCQTRRLQWKNSDMEAAMVAVSSKEMTISAAAKNFSVPRKTLDDRVKGHVVHGRRPGVSTVLTPEEETSLASYLIYMAERGFPLTRTMVKAFAWAIAKRSGKEERFNVEYGPGDHWWALFKKRHSSLALRKADSLERSRAEALNPQIVREYFELLDATLTKNNLKNKPRYQYNCDETFLPLDYTREKVVASRGAKVVYSQTHGTSDHISLLCCASAAGIPLPPMIIYAKSFPGGPYRFQGPDDALYAKSESGWIDSELFLSWLKKIFLKYAVPQRPILLLTDGHKSHLTLEVVDTCRENDIILFCLPPHTTHALQPLDVAVFKSLKDNFSKAVRALSFSKKNFVVTKREFSKVLKSPFEKSFSIPNIKSGFAKCGICPFDPDAISKEKMKPSTLYGTSQFSTSSASDSSSPCPTSSPTNVAPDSSPEVHPVSSETCVLSLNSPSSNTPPSSTVCSPCITTTASSSPCIIAPVLTPPSSTPPTSTSSTSNSSVEDGRIVNPLFTVGLVSPDLSDILAIPEDDAAVVKKRTKRITGARDLTADGYAEMLRADKRKKEEAEEQKKKRKEDRESKKKEKEKRQSERNKRGRGRGRGHGRGRRSIASRRLDMESSESETDSVQAESDVSDTEDPIGASQDLQPGPSRPCRRRQMPARFCDSDSDQNDGVLCVLCNENSPVDLPDSTVFWVDCSKCGCWVHNVCAFGKNAVTRKYTCISCSES